MAWRTGREIIDFRKGKNINCQRYRRIPGLEVDDEGIAMTALQDREEKEDDTVKLQH